MADKYISVEAASQALCRACGLVACDRARCSYFMAIQNVQAADVVSRDCFNGILAENDTMREQLSAIGKKPGDSMDDVRIAKFGVWRHSWAEGRFVFRCSNCNNFLAGNPNDAKVCPGCMAEMKVEDNA